MKSSANLMLAGLPVPDAAFVAPRLRPFKCAAREVIFAAGGHLDRVIFPETCVISMVIELPEGRSVECAIVGSEGVAGFGGATTIEMSHSLQVAQMPGEGLQMSAADLRISIANCPIFAKRLHGFHDALVALSFQATACVATHPVENRLARWMLQMLDRTKKNELPFTHELLAQMAATTRTTATLALRSFEQAGLIETHRSRVVVLDRVGLKEVSCGCYQATRAMYASHGLVKQ